MSVGAWDTPLGRVSIDAELAADLKRRFPPLGEDTEAHRAEHGAEVQLPFLQVKNSQVQFRADRPGDQPI